MDIEELRELERRCERQLAAKASHVRLLEALHNFLLFAGEVPPDDEEEPGTGSTASRVEVKLPEELETRISSALARAKSVEAPVPDDSLPPINLTKLRTETRAQRLEDLKKAYLFSGPKKAGPRLAPRNTDKISNAPAPKTKGRPTASGTSTTLPPIEQPSRATSEVEILVSAPPVRRNEPPGVRAPTFFEKATARGRALGFSRAQLAKRADFALDCLGFRAPKAGPESEHRARLEALLHRRLGLDEPSGGESMEVTVARRLRPQREFLATLELALTHGEAFVVLIEGKEHYRRFLTSLYEKLYWLYRQRREKGLETSKTRVIEPPISQRAARLLAEVEDLKRQASNVRSKAQLVQLVGQLRKILYYCEGKQPLYMFV